VKRWAIYRLLRLLRWLARWFPNLKVPRWVPLAGDIDGHSWAPPVDVRGGRAFGDSMTVPAILEIRVDGTRGTTNPPALAPVATRLFPGYAPFIFNVSFACGRARAFRPGIYGDPRSPWFNVFVGYYQIDVARSAWNRPFGYRPAPGGGFEPEVADLARLGEADWNYFSNYMYGVPLDVVEATDRPEAQFTVLPQVEIAGHRWDQLEATGMKVVSSYLAADDRRRLVDNDKLLSGVWRCVFGEPFRDRRPAAPPASFFPTPMRARLYACYTADEHDRDLREPVYRTLIFGGTVNEWWGAHDPDGAARNAAFLDLQMQTIRSLIARRFAHLGFR
jgi:hypothetical protein